MLRTGSGQMPHAIARLIAGRRLATTLSAIGATALVTGAVVATELPGSSRGASRGSSGSGSTTVQRRNLVATDTESGTLSYSNPQTVFNRVSGTITSLPAIGHVIKPGQTLYRVDGLPVVLFSGIVPAYRDLSDGVTDGADVEQLKKNLIALGFDPEHTMTVNQIFDVATTAAVERWQGSLGETETGTVTLGQVVFLPGAQRITSVDTVLGSTGGASGGSGSSGTSASTSLTPLAPRAQFVSLTTTSAGAGSASGSGPASGTGSGSGAGMTSGSGAGTGSSVAGARSAVSKAAQTACPAPGASLPPGVTTTTTPTTTTTTTTTTPVGTSTTATCDTADSNAATSAPNNLITARTRTPVPGKSGSRNPSQEAVLLALLKAETLELRKTLSSSRSSTSGSGATGSSRGSGATTGGSGGTGGSTRSSGASSSSVSGSGSSSASSSAGSASGTASAGSSAQAILQTTSNQLVVTVALDATKQSEAVVGEPVSVQLPSGDTVGGRITQVSPIAQSSSSSSSSSSGAGGGSSSAPSATIPVTIKILGRHPVAGLDQAAVSVNFEQQVEKNVLSVPVTALLATAGGGYAVQEAGTPHRLLAVTPGLFAAGYVQISGADIYSGLQVTDSQG